MKNPCKESEAAEEKLEQTAAQEAAALAVLRALLGALRPYTENVAAHGETYCNYCGRSQGEWVRYDSKWKQVHRDNCPIGLALLVLSDPPKAATVVLKRLAKLETEVEDLHGALRSVQTSLGLASDMLVRPGALVGRAQDFIEEALVAVREGLEESSDNAPPAA